MCSRKLTAPGIPHSFNSPKLENFPHKPPPVISEIKKNPALWKTNHVKYSHKFLECWNFHDFTAVCKEMETVGLEPMTFWLPVRRSPNWATPPWAFLLFYTIFHKNASNICNFFHFFHTQPSLLSLIPSYFQESSRTSNHTITVNGFLWIVILG